MAVLYPYHLSGRRGLTCRKEKNKIRNQQSRMLGRFDEPRRGLSDHAATIYRQ